ncbi:MAG TPA: UvrD-helicase domain-containing protein [Saprospiraceae bacterium]|nr:UvrD-helicase domain-containing protein [Saprospiraceae bacterium]
MNLQIISAGAGSGKTWRLTQEMTRLLKEGVRAEGIIATTFTQKAAAELQERVRVRLLEEGLSEQADQLANALIGTVHSLGVKLLQRFAFEAGVSPQVDIIAEEDQQLIFNQSLAMVLTQERVALMEALSERLGWNKREFSDWRREVRQITDVARANDFSLDVLQKSKKLSFELFKPFLDELRDQGDVNLLLMQLAERMDETIQALSQNGDETKKTKDVIVTLKGLQRHLRLGKDMPWYEWARLGKLDVAVKSRDSLKPLQDFTDQHLSHPAFHRDIEQFISTLFDIAIAALQEYEQYKKSRGLIDYTDMEVMVKRLLEKEGVRQVLASELDLLLVDEFQDTSPIQLEIFLRLSAIARHSIWVGDPKQSIYGFRGAAPELMQAIISATGGIKKENIQLYSWRSRPDIVHLTNAIFSKAFSDLPVEQVALIPKREDPTPLDRPSLAGKEALMHWHFKYDGEGNRQPGKPWMENCLAFALREWLDRQIGIIPKGRNAPRPARPGDVAILCRSNAECGIVAEALHRAGLKASISRAGLLATAESRLVLACLKYLLHQYDSLSVAEILLLAARLDIEEIIESRLDHLDQLEKARQEGGERFNNQWGEGVAVIDGLNALRVRVGELSSAETLDVVLDELDLRRTMASWGNQQQRLDNIDLLRKLALEYESSCNRLHTATSQGGFLLWLAELETAKKDTQAAGESDDAVQVLTYHRSKGLEWPIVICHSLETRLRAEVWGLELISDRAEVDLEEVLGGRWLRYWVNPYADQHRRTTLMERVEASDAQQSAQLKALKEEARLLYVGLTRARDYLILPSTKQPTRWLNRVWHAGQEDHPTLNADSGESPWEWAGKYLKIQTEHFLYGQDFPFVAAAEEAISFLPPRQGRAVFEAARIDADESTFVTDFNLEIGDPMIYYSQAGWSEDQDLYAIAKAMKAFLTADRAEYPASDRLKMAQDLLHRYQLPDRDATTFLERSRAWQNYRNSHFSTTAMHRKYPIRYFHQSRLFETIADLILETPEGLVLIQNSGFAGKGAAKFRQKAQELGTWVFLSKSALEKIFAQARIRCFIHFVMEGILLEIKVEKSKEG